MLISDKPVFMQLMQSLGELYGKKVTPTLLRLYFAALERFSLTDVQKAFNQHVNNPDVGQFMPKPADIVRYLEGTQRLMP